MINIPDSCTILAPAAMHLVLYKEILEQKQNSKGIQVITLDSFLSPFYQGELKKDTEILFEYKQALNHLSSHNAFYSSRNDYDFLTSCLDFIKWAKTMNITQFSSNTQKEKDLYEILQLLYPIQIKEDQTQKVKQRIQFHDLYILKKEYSKLEMVWIEYLLSLGAKWLGENNLKETHYYTCANSRKQMEVIAQTIIDQNYSANDIFIALNDPNEENVLTQILSAYQIPYTKLKESKHTNIYTQWISLLKYFQNPNIKTFIEVLYNVYPKDQYIRQYFEIYPEQFGKPKFLNTYTYQENEIIDERTFDHLQELETYTYQWIDEHPYLFQNLDYEVIAANIQAQYEKIEKEDLNAFHAVMECIQDAYPYIHDTQDLSILIQEINHLSTNQKAATIQGVLIGSRKDITTLRDIVFLCGTSSKNFPKLSLETGIFDETYIENLAFPNLETRIQAQQTQIFDCLSLPKELYVLYPLSNYQGKANTPSLDMKNWIHKPETFKTTLDSFIWEQPKFDMSEDLAQKLYFNDDHFRASVSRLETFANCPLKYTLQYGLHLYEKKDITDIRTRGSVLHHVLETLANEHGKQYCDVNKEELRSYIEKEYTFAKNIYPNEIHTFNDQVEEYTELLSFVFEQLQNFEKNWHMHIDQLEKQIHYEFSWKQYTIELIGYVDRIDSSSTSFCIFDYKSSNKDITYQEFQTGTNIQLGTYALAVQQETKKVPIGSFYIALKTSPEELIPYKASYRSSFPKLEEIDPQDVLEQFAKNRKLNGWTLGDTSLYCDDPKKYLNKKRDNPTFEKMQDDWQEIIDSLLSDIHSGYTLPNHMKDACKFCAYKNICRNAANEIEAPIRTKEDN